MNYAEVIATGICDAMEAPKGMIPVIKQAILDGAVKSGFVPEETDLLDELSPTEALDKLRVMRKNKKAMLKLLDSFAPAGMPSLVAQGLMLSQITQAVEEMQQKAVTPTQLPKAKPARWSPLRMFKGKRERT
jgi:hypothetical protein